MNIEKRYDSCLSDVITLLQEAVYRFIAELEVDLSKFFQYFKQFHRNLVSLQNSFHPSKTKFSRYLSKIDELGQSIDLKVKEKTISLEPESEKLFYKTGKSKLLRGESTSNKLHTIEKTQELNVIGEIEQRQDFEAINLNLQQNRMNLKQNRINDDSACNRKRVGTAQGLRQKMSVTIDFHNHRPYTGSNKRQGIRKESFSNSNSRVKDRYRSLTKYEKSSVNNQQSKITINHQGSQNDKLHQQLNYYPYPQLYPQPEQAIIQESTQKKIFNLGQKKSIYDVLEQERKFKNELQIDQQFLRSGLIKIPEKRRDKHWSRWSFKINKLL